GAGRGGGGRGGGGGGGGGRGRGGGGGGGGGGGRLLGGGTGGLSLHRQYQLRQSEATQRQRDQQKVAEEALEKAAQLQRLARWAEAESVLGQAQRLLGEGVPEEARARLADALADAALVGELEAIRLKKADLVESRFACAGGDRV